MDWSKAKTILIIMFLIADIFLGYQYINQNQQSSPTITQESINETVDYLKKQNIFIQGPIPNKAIQMPNIKVKYKSFHQEEIMNTFFANNDKAPNVISDKENLIIEDDKIQIQIKKEKELYYLNKTIHMQQGEIDEAACKKLAENFLSKVGIYGAATEVVKNNIADGYIVMSGVQRYKGLFVDGTQIEMMVNEEGVYKATLLWFGDIKPNESKTKPVISALKALEMASKVLTDKYDNVNIFEIKQGYYFGTNELEQFDLKMIEEGTAVPVWRIKADKATIFINAYNGQLEK